MKIVFIIIPNRSLSSKHTAPAGWQTKTWLLWIYPSSNQAAKKCVGLGLVFTRHMAMVRSFAWAQVSRWVCRDRGSE